MSETFIKIDSLQHLEISREIQPTNRPKIRVTTFTVLTLCFLKFLIENNNSCISISKIHLIIISIVRQLRLFDEIQ